jgi:hypothetical protein
MRYSQSLAPPLPSNHSLRSIPDRYAALLIAGVAVAAALAARLAWPFDGLYGQDAFAYVRYARALWPWLLRGEPLPIYYWPAGYPLLVALALPLFGGEAAAGQAVSLVSVAAGAACTFLLSRELLEDAPGGRLAAWAAGLAVALSGDALRAGLVAMSDALAMACCAAAIWALARYGRTRRYPDAGRGGRWLAAAALALGWATITRWVCGLLAAPLVLAVLIDLLTKDEGPRTNASDDDTPQFYSGTNAIGLSSFVFRLRGFIPHAVVAMAVGAAIVLPQLLAIQATPLALSRHQWLLSWDIANAWRRDFATVDGAQHYALPVAAYYLARMAWPGFLFPPLALLCLPGALWLARRRCWPALALLAGWPLLLWLFLSGIPYQNARFALPALPALAALAGLGFGWVYEATTDDGRRTTDHHDRQPKVRVRPRSSASYLPARSLTRWARVLLVAGLILSLFGSLAWGARDYRNLVAYKNEQLALVEWARARLPAGGVLIAFGATLTLQHYADYDVRELFYLAPPDLDAIVRQHRPVYLLLDAGNIETQWAGLRPWEDYRYLQQRPGLEVVGRHGPYTLFRIKS